MVTISAYAADVLATHVTAVAESSASVLSALMAFTARLGASAENREEGEERRVTAMVIP